MNNKRVKAYRKEARQILSKEYSSSLELFRWMPFRDRLKIAWAIVKGRGRGNP